MGIASTGGCTSSSKECKRTKNCSKHTQNVKAIDRSTVGSSLSGRGGTGSRATDSAILNRRCRIGYRPVRAYLPPGLAYVVRWWRWIQYYLPRE
jgi:hypothetical protein